MIVFLLKDAKSFRESKQFAGKVKQNPAKSVGEMLKRVKKGAPIIISIISNIILCLPVEGPRPS